MFGSPLLSTALLVLFFGAIALPLQWVMRPYTPKVSSGAPPLFPSQSQQEEGTPAFLTIRAAHPFSQLTIRANGKALISEEMVASEYEIDFLVGKELELEFDLTWPPQTPETAVLFIVEPDAKPRQSVTYWGQTRLNRRHLFSWEN